MQFIEAQANSRYQRQPPSGAFEYLLLNGRVVVIFDGLDELLDTSYRQDISADVESFCTCYPSVPILVTSREIGYDQAPLDEQKFQTFLLAPFDEKQVQEYVAKWFALDTDLNAKEQQEKAESFLEESQVVPDLRSNPLMLSLMCNIYRGENYIPRNRPDLYEKCATMLFERWDRGRGIHVSLPFGARTFEMDISPVVKYLAHWIYADEALRGGVTEERLIRKAAEYLYPKRFEDYDQAQGAAREFIEFCRGRSWVLTATGSTRQGENLYQFTHPTFLEYFTAAYLVRTHRTPEELLTVLQPRIAKREWDVVAQVAFQLQSKNFDGAGDELLNALIIQAHERQAGDRSNILSFAARCLEFIVPSPEITRSIVLTCLEYCLSRGLERIKSRKLSSDPDPDDRVTELLGSLFYSISDNPRQIGGTVETFLIERANGSNEQEAFLALELATLLDSPFFLSRSRRQRQPRSTGDFYDFWQSVANRIHLSCSERLSALYPKYPSLCNRGFWRGDVKIADLINWYGPERLFKGVTFTVYPNAGFIPPVEWLLPTLGNLDAEAVKRSIVVDSLKELGHILPSYLPLKVQWAGRGTIQELAKYSKGPLELDSDMFFGVFCLFAIAYEPNEHGEMLEANTARAVKKELSRTLKPIALILLQRFEGSFEPKAMTKFHRELDLAGFTTEQQGFILRWVRREVNFTQPEAVQNNTGQEELPDEE